MNWEVWIISDYRDQRDLRESEFSETVQAVARAKALRSVGLTVEIREGSEDA